jgi:hypothetical protein
MPMDRMSKQTVASGLLKRVLPTIQVCFSQIQSLSRVRALHLIIMVKEQRTFQVTVNSRRTNYYDKRVDLAAKSENDGEQLNLALNDCRWPVVLEDFKRLRLVHEDDLDALQDVLAANSEGSFSVWCTRIDLTAIGFRLASTTNRRVPEARG